MRWVCPKCENGCLGPSRPRRDDTRRYCLACSAKTGRMVERVAPARERAREQSAAKRTARSQAERAAAQHAARQYPACLQAEWARMLRLPLARQYLKGPIALKVRKGTGPWTPGHAWYGRSLVTITAGTEESGARETLLHELAHHIVHRKFPRDRLLLGDGLGPGRAVKSHGTEFRAVLAELACQWLGRDVPLARQTARVLDRSIQDEIRRDICAVTTVAQFFAWVAELP